MAVPQTIEITDGTTAINLLSGVIRLEQDGWEPQIAPDRGSDLGGQSPYEDVEEALRLQAVYAAGVNVGAAYAAIQRLLAQARRWALGDPSAAPVRLRAAPAGGTKILESVVTGGHLPQLPASFHRLYQAGALPSVEATIRRRGWWLNPTYEEAASSAATLQELMTVTFPSSQAHMSPIGLVVSQASGTTYANPTSGGLILAPSASAFQTINAEGLAGTSGYSSVVDASCRNGAKLRYSGGSGWVYASTTAAITSSAVFDIYVLATTTATCQIKFRLMPGGIESDPATIAYRGLNGPNLIYAGTVRIPEPLAPTAIQIAANATVGTDLDIDTILIVSHAYGPVVPILWPELTGPSGTGSGAGNYTVATIDHAPLSRRVATIGQAPNNAAWTGMLGALSGDVGDGAIWMAGQTLVGWLSLSHLTPFRVSTTNTYQISARRYPAYLSLE